MHHINLSIFYYCKIILIIVFVIKPFKIILFYNILEETTFTNKESAMYCKDCQIVNIYIYKYVFINLEYFFSVLY